MDRRYELYVQYILFRVRHDTGWIWSTRWPEGWRCWQLGILWQEAMLKVSCIIFLAAIDIKELIVEAANPIETVAGLAAFLRQPRVLDDIILAQNYINLSRWMTRKFHNLIGSIEELAMYPSNNLEKWCWVLTKVSQWCLQEGFRGDIYWFNREVDRRNEWLGHRKRREAWMMNRILAIHSFTTVGEIHSKVTVWYSPVDFYIRSAE